MARPPTWSYNLYIFWDSQISREIHWLAVETYALIIGKKKLLVKTFIGARTK